jgi:hypothetical protein
MTFPSPKGVNMDVASFETKQAVHATILMNNSDLPASRKTSGLAPKNGSVHSAHNNSLP